MLLTPSRLVCLTLFAVGCYEILGMAINSFNVPLEPGVAPLAPEVRARMPGTGP